MYNSENLTKPKSSLGGVFMKYSFFKSRKTPYTYWSKPLLLNTFNSISHLDYFLITNKQM
ncbi:hypothetical protein [Clostridium tagluense]|uniref:hypothetical protein n=1 Tax=Clostridium tagluense TaxID=360422 RepID=UPI001C0ACC82|nr:hypothetical protein [Clostridium tagluense]MBU3129168.1 hypothetical protein [Clostridium tagluense]